MKFVIITHTIHKFSKGKLFAYEPYVREMNLWLNYVNETKVVSPVVDSAVKPIESYYSSKCLAVKKIASFNLLNLNSAILTVFKIPFILVKIFNVMFWADHIHLRCPGNIGLLGCFVQILFPHKPKTVKYAGNWDPNSKQPISYKLQKWIISNTILTKNCKVLVYGNWKNQSKNIVPFFTASYRNEEIEIIDQKSLQSKIKFIFVGSFTTSKRPLLSVKVIEELLNSNVNNIELNMYGNGSEYDQIKKYVNEKKLEKYINLHGNQSKEIVKKAYQRSHFLLFISKSEGWPKVVAEAMFWGCLPIASSVSCIEEMLGYGKRGSIVNANCNAVEVASLIKKYIKEENAYQTKVMEAKKWSQQYTLDKFEQEIKKILLNE